MEAGFALGPTPMTGFKDFYQYASTTRVIAGRDLLSSTGFEFQKEGARRVFVVTDEVVRGTGLVDRIEAGVTDGGLEVVGVYDRVPPWVNTASATFAVSITEPPPIARNESAPASFAAAAHSSQTCVEESCGTLP